MGQAQSTRAKEFYEACSNGNFKRVRELLPTLTYEELNYTDPNTGYTPLHAACSNNHIKIVQLLLEQKACNRILSNKDGTTAYDISTLPNIRSLFARQRNERLDNRFVDISIEQSSFRLTSTRALASACPNNWLKGHTSATEANDSQLMVALSQTSNLLMKKFVSVRSEKESRERVYLLIHCHIPATQSERQLAIELYKQFVHRKSVESLLTLYSLETPLYRALQSDADAYTLLLYLHLNELDKRAYQGDTYRGAMMTNSDLDAYRWARTNSAILETRSLQSTSKLLDVATQFAPPLPKTSSRLSIILHFKFANTCPSAIDLKGLSNFPDEEEVLLLPFTLFKVLSIEKHEIDTDQQFEIIMENAPVPKKTPWSIVRKMNENQ